MKLPHGERVALERKKELLAAADARIAVDDQGDGYYRMPDEYLTEHGKIDNARKQRALSQRHEDARPKEGDFVTDVDHWEETQARGSALVSGMRGRSEEVDGYDYVFDESQAIEFVEGHVMDGGKQGSTVDQLLQARVDEAEKRGTFLPHSWRYCLLTSIQCNLLKRRASPSRSTPVGIKFSTPYAHTKFSSSSRKQGLARPPSCRSTCTKQGTLPTGRRSAARSRAAWPPWPSLRVSRRRWGRNSEMR